jgi:hypothetical protein
MCSGGVRGKDRQGRTTQVVAMGVMAHGFGILMVLIIALPLIT